VLKYITIWASFYKAKMDIDQHCRANFAKYKLFLLDNAFVKSLAPNKYPLNYEIVNKWINEQPEKRDRQFAASAISCVKYIPFDFFKSELESMAFYITQQLEKNQYENVIIVLPDKLSKSNIWVSILLFNNALIAKCTHVCGTIEDACKIAQQTSKKTLCLFPDDASYSGKQIDLELGDIDSYRQLKGSFKVLICCAFITTTAINLLKKDYDDFVLIYKNVNIMQTLKEKIDTINLPRDLSSDEPGRFAFQFYEKVHSFYFDHKIADTLSTIQKILMLGPVKKSDPQDVPIPLINNCSPDSYSPDDVKNLNNTYLVDITELAGHCPKTFYKTIKYQKNGKLLDDDLFIKILIAW
jgi:hypothetical protein